MSNFSVVRSSFADYFRMVQRRVHELAEPLSTDQLWHNPYPYGNSIANLIQHLTGNLNYYLGTQIAGTGYVRHRDQEFENAFDQSGLGRSKTELLSAFDEAITMCVRTVSAQSDSDWSLPYEAQLVDGANRFQQILACAGHAYHHVGQIIYLQRELLRQAG
jgi:uncharacterized damage-inducible protein DinB